MAVRRFFLLASLPWALLLNVVARSSMPEERAIGSSCPLFRLLASETLPDLLPLDEGGLSPEHPGLGLVPSYFLPFAMVDCRSHSSLLDLRPGLILARLLPLVPESEGESPPPTRQPQYVAGGIASPSSPWAQWIALWLLPELIRQPAPRWWVVSIHPHSHSVRYPVLR